MEIELTKEPLRVGRSVQPLPVWQQLIPDEATRNTISRIHFEVVRQGGAFLLRNLSAQGTLVNGSTVEEVILKNGDIISMGQVGSEYGNRPALQFKVHLCEDLIAKASFSVRLWWLLPGANGTGPTVLNKQLLAGPSGAVRVGRAMQPIEFWQTLVPDESLRNAISREHFDVCPTADGVMLINRSIAGTLHNGVLVQHQTRVNSGDVLAIPLHNQPKEPPIVQFRLECAAIPDPDFEDGAAPRLLGAKAGSVDAALSPKEKEAADVVKIAVDALPPPFSLECVAARGAEGRDLEQLPMASRVLAASFSQVELSVGSSHQSGDFWELLLKDPALRTQILPLHFRLEMAQLSDGPMLILDAHAATELNGKLVEGKAPVLQNDLISIAGTTNGLTDDVPLVCFRVNSALS